MLNNLSQRSAAETWMSGPWCGAPRRYERLRVAGVTKTASTPANRTGGNNPGKTHLNHTQLYSTLHSWETLTLASSMHPVERSSSVTVYPSPAVLSCTVQDLNRRPIPHSLVRDTCPPSAAL